jgi:hypothetical protein
MTCNTNNIIGKICCFIPNTGQIHLPLASSKLCPRHFSTVVDLMSFKLMFSYETICCCFVLHILNRCKPLSISRNFLLLGLGMIKGHVYFHDRCFWCLQLLTHFLLITIFLPVALLHFCFA